MSQYKLQVTLVEAINLRDVQSFGKQDPYGIVRLGSTWFKTKVHKDGGKKAFWNETFDLPARLDCNVKIEVNNKNVTDKEKIGECEVPISQFLHGGVVDAWYELFHGKKKAGQVHLRCQFSPPIAGHTAPATGSMSHPINTSATQPLAGHVSGAAQTAMMGGMAQPGMGMAQPAMGMAQPAMGMAQPAMGMAQPAMGMAQPMATAPMATAPATMAMATPAMATPATGAYAAHSAALAKPPMSAAPMAATPAMAQPVAGMTAQMGSMHVTPGVAQPMAGQPMMAGQMPGMARPVQQPMMAGQMPGQPMMMQQPMMQQPMMAGQMPGQPMMMQQPGMVRPMQAGTPMMMAGGHQPGMMMMGGHGAMAGCHKCGGTGYKFKKGMQKPCKCMKKGHKHKKHHY
eukprot:TRINITY_DN335_c0_g1_i1.p1 TRINITY_DN335_c0_g1~~TRINITY_DN335_c0_g1_i1.p1  ORF type:complete len:399 (-),score=160.10 TRINITY_DN335_c0_g1_i1:312-1508(-)